MLTQNEPSVVYFLVHHVHLHHTVLFNEFYPVIAGKSESAVRAQLAQLSKLNEADKLFNVKVKKGAVFPPVLDFKAKHLFLVLFNNQKVNLRLNINVIALELVYELHLLLVKVLLALRTQDTVDLLQFELCLFMRILDLVDVTTDERFVHFVLIGQVRKAV